jgi:LuxR family transcriptional regulator, maltose regulon positive regulatory protein
LRQGCALVEATGAVRALLDQPQPLQPLLQARMALPAAPWSPALLDELQRAVQDADATQPPAVSVGQLSPRERHILGLLSDGQSNKEIARGLGIAPETVKTHVSRIFGKLGVRTRAQAAVMLKQA